MLSRLSRCSVLAIAILTTSTSVTSKEINWSYIEGVYGSTTISSLAEDIDGTGFGVSGSFSLTQNIALTGGYGAINFDTVEGVDLSTTSLSIGVIAHTLIADNTSLFGKFSFFEGDIEVTDGFTTISDDDTGNVISIGLRHMATDVIEIAIGLSRTDIFDDTNNAFELGARFYDDERFSFGVAYGSGDDVESIIFDFRFDIS